MTRFNWVLHHIMDILTGKGQQCADKVKRQEEGKKCDFAKSISFAYHGGSKS